MIGAAGPQSFALLLGLGQVPASVDEVLRELGGRLDDLEPRLWREEGQLRLALTVPAVDVWIAALTAMAALTQTGYPALSLDVRPGAAPD